MAILSAKDVRKYFGEFCALDGVSFDVHEGEFVSVIGPTARENYADQRADRVTPA